MQQFFTTSAHQLWTAIAVLGLLSAALGFFLFDLRLKWQKLFGNKADSREELLKETLERVAQLETRMKNIEPRVEILEKISQIAVQKVAFRRFNPFENTGGDQSFVFVLLDHKNNGVIISSLYAREGTRMYGKEVGGGKAKQPLSDEEHSLLQEAISKKI